jgi:hypothetical protein
MPMLPSLPVSVSIRWLAPGYRAYTKAVYIVARIRFIVAAISWNQASTASF